MSEIIYGVRGIDGKTICIDEVPYDKSGLLCDCTCAYCGRNLQACSLNGKVSPYFRHHTEKRDGSHYRSKFICNPNIPEPEIGMKLFHQQYGNLRIISIEKRTDKTIIVVEDSYGAISNKTWEVLWKNNLIRIIDK